MTSLTGDLRQHNFVRVDVGNFRGREVAVALKRELRFSGFRLGWLLLWSPSDYLSTHTGHFDDEASKQQFANAKIFALNTSNGLTASASQDNW